MRKFFTFLIVLAVTVGVSVSSFGQVGQIPTYIQPAPSGASFSLTYESIANSTAHTTTVDFGTMTYGSGCTRVVVGIGTFAVGVGVSSVTINGVAASAISGTTTATNVPSTIWQTNSAVSGSSGDVQVTFSAAPLDNSAVSLYCLVTSTPTPSSGQSNSTTGAATISQSITVPTGGGAVAFASGYNGGGTTGPNFTNATSDALDNTAGQVIANAGHLTSTGSVSVTAAVSGGSFVSLSLAAWGP
jgi:adhesin HecA-like repeat protein